VKGSPGTKQTKSNRLLLYVVLLVLVMASVIGAQAFTRAQSASALRNQQATDLSFSQADSNDGQSEILSAEPARYNLASVQASYSLKVEAGGRAQGQLYFYNVDGNRPTHIKLDATIVPNGIELGFDYEYLLVEPTNVYAEPVTNIPEGMTSLALANKLGDGVTGYCLAHVVDVIVYAMDDAGLGDAGDVRVKTTASWMGQTGQAQISQTRSFDFSVKVVQ